MFQVEWKKLRAPVVAAVLAVGVTVAVMPLKPVVAQSAPQQRSPPLAPTPCLPASGRTPPPNLLKSASIPSPNQKTQPPVICTTG